jgi:Uma2 family endonuclease
LPSARRGADTMGMPAPTYYTAEMVRALPEDGNKYEVVHGELLVTPAPRMWHEELWARVFEALRAYVRTEPGVDHVFGSRSDISYGPDTLVSPDIIVVPLEEARTDDWSKIRHLLLVVEVLSASSKRHDRFTKRRLYQEQAVPLYWIVDPEAKTVEVWTPDARFPQIERERVVWHPADAATPLALALADLFRPL